MTHFSRTVGVTGRSIQRFTRRRSELLEGIVTAMVAAVDAKDPYTAGHSERVAVLATQLGKAAGVTAAETDLIRLGALLHDIGKIGIPDDVLKKPERLTPEEYQIIKRHPTIGGYILQPISRIPPQVLEIVRFHHERWDGQGYPAGRRGSDIPLLARIVGIADAWDAMTSSRAYRPALRPEEAVAELLRAMERQFDPQLLPVFVERVVCVCGEIRRNDTFA